VTLVIRTYFWGIILGFRRTLRGTDHFVSGVQYNAVWLS